MGGRPQPVGGLNPPTPPTNRTLITAYGQNSLAKLACINKHRPISKRIRQWRSAAGLALGMFQLFIRTGPPILGGRQFCQNQVVDECNASVCSFVATPLYGICWFLTHTTNTHDYWLITYVQYCTVHESMWRSGLRSEPRWGAYSALQSPDRP